MRPLDELYFADGLNVEIFDDTRVARTAFSPPYKQGVAKPIYTFCTRFDKRDLRTYNGHS